MVVKGSGRIRDNRSHISPVGAVGGIVIARMAKLLQAYEGVRKLPQARLESRTIKKFSFRLGEQRES